MGYHDTRIQRCEIERGNRTLVEVLLRLDNHSPFELLVSFLRPLTGYDHIILRSLPIQLRGHFYLLSPREQVIQGDSCHSHHLGVDINDRELVHES